MWGWGSINIASSIISSTPSFVLSETWDNDVEDNTWTALPTNWDDDDTANTIDGAQCLSTDTGDNATMSTD